MGLQDQPCVIAGSPRKQDSVEWGSGRPWASFFIGSVDQRRVPVGGVEIMSTDPWALSIANEETAKGACFVVQGRVESNSF